MLAKTVKSCKLAKRAGCGRNQKGASRSNRRWAPRGAAYALARGVGVGLGL